MKASELRIGNLVYDSSGNIEAVSELVHHNEVLHNINDLSEEYFKPIPLTEEWPLKFGFIQFEDSVDEMDDLRYLYNLSDKTQIGVDTEGRYFLIHVAANFCEDKEAYKISKAFQYVHQLQNLYFALTGEELIYNE